MKKILLSVMGGALFCFSLMFSSCGNFDNPLEEIVNSNPQVAALAGAINENAVVSFDLKFHALNYEVPIQVKFKKVGDKYDFVSADYQIPDGFEGALEELGAESDADIIRYVLTENTAEELLKLNNDKASNQLKVSFVFDLASIEGTCSGEGDDETTPIKFTLLTVVFDVNTNKYTQYIYPFFEGSFLIWEGVSVDGEDKSNLLKTDYAEKAEFFDGPNVDGPQDNEPLVFVAYYKDGETWKDVNERYKAIDAQYPLLQEYEDDGEIYPDFFIDADSGPFIFFREYYESGDAVDYEKVKYGEKVGYKGTTPLTKGYYIDDDGREDVNYS